jgi:uncharacterized protein YndB with AHSA1/START domain
VGAADVAVVAARALGLGGARAGGHLRAALRRTHLRGTPEGEEHDWGEVLAWEPPRRLAYLWHLRFDRSDATEVDVTFTEAPEGTAVRIVHRGWERLGAKGLERRARNRKGWAGVIEHYSQACDGAAA